MAVMFECLSSLVVGNPLLEPKLLGTEPPRRGTQNSVVAAVDIGTFTDVESYKEHVDSLIDGIKALPRADGFEEILVPGELEDKVLEDRLRHGIPLPEGTVRNLRQVAQRLDIKLPAGFPRIAPG